MNPPWERHSPTEWRINYGTLVIASLVSPRWGALDRRYADLSVRARLERGFRGAVGFCQLDEMGQPSLPRRIDNMIRSNWPEVYGNN